MYLIIGLILLIFIIIKFRLLINFKSFFKRGFRPKRGIWGIYCYHGSQGKGKTFSLTEYIVTHNDKSIYYSNYHLNGIEYNFYTGFDGLMRIKDDLDNGKIIVPKGKQLVIIYDEIFTELMKGCDVRTIEQTGEAFEDGDTYVSLKYCADMLSGFLVDNGLIDEKPSNLDDLFDSSVYDEVRSELEK